MKPEIFVKQVKNAFANGKTGILATIFRHEIMLTVEEADKLQKDLMAAMWGLAIKPANGKRLE